MSFSNLRRNPFTGAISWRVMPPEVHVISELANLPGFYGFQLIDKPKPNSVSILVNISGGNVFDIVTTNPLAGQVRIDFDQGYLVFNLADIATEVVVNYEGGGTNANLENLSSLVLASGLSFIDGEIHGLNVNDVFTDNLYTTNNKTIDLSQSVNVITESVKVFVNSLRLTGEVGSNPENMQGDFMVKSNSSRVWFNDSHGISNTDLIVVDYRRIV